MTSSTGHFADGPFIGLDYRTSSNKGTTGSDGRFLFQEGEQITFSVGALDIGSTSAASTLTLADLRSSNDAKSGKDRDLHKPGTVNRARFLLSLGMEHDLRNGVKITPSVRDIISVNKDNINFHAEAKEFEKSSSLQTIFNKIGLRLRTEAEARNHLRRRQAGIKVLRDVPITARDGCVLYSDIFTPLQPGKYPVLIRLGVYGRSFHFGSRKTQAQWDTSEQMEDDWHEKSRNHLNSYFRYAESFVSANATDWVPRGYVLVRVDGRGVGQNSGILAPFSQKEAEDFYDSIQWAAEQSWSNGNIGIYGASYNATVQWNVAMLQPPALKAIAPLAGDCDGYRDLSHSGGIFLEKYRDRWYNEIVEAARNKEAERTDLVGGMASHPWDDEYYQPAPAGTVLTADFSKIHIPVLTSVSQGLFIHSRAGFEAFTQLPSTTPKQLLMWDAQYSSWMFEDSRKDLEDFFDHYLKGKKLAQAPSPVKLVVRTGDGGYEWRDFPTWPVPGTEYRKFFLDARNVNGLGVLAGGAPADERVVEYSAEVERKDLLNGSFTSAISLGSRQTKDLPMAIFETAPLAEGLELAGHFRATLWISSSSKDADIFVTVRVMDGDRHVPYRTREKDSVAPLTWGLLKASQRKTSPERSTPERPWHTHKREDVQPLVPDEKVQLDVELMPATSRIPAGRKLRVEISPVDSWADMPGIEKKYAESYHRGAVNRIHTGGAFASAISVPVVPTVIR